MGCRCEDIKACERDIEILQETWNYNEDEKIHDESVIQSVKEIADDTYNAYEANNMNEIWNGIVKLDDTLAQNREAFSSAIVNEISSLENKLVELEEEDKEFHQKEE